MQELDDRLASMQNIFEARGQRHGSMNPWLESQLSLNEDADPPPSPSRIPPDTSSSSPRGTRGPDEKPQKPAARSRSQAPKHRKVAQREPKKISEAERKRLEEEKALQEKQEKEELMRKRADREARLREIEKKKQDAKQRREERERLMFQKKKQKREAEMARKKQLEQIKKKRTEAGEDSAATSLKATSSSAAPRRRSKLAQVMGKKRKGRSPAPSPPSRTFRTQGSVKTVRMTCMRTRDYRESNIFKIQEMQADDQGFEGYSERQKRREKEREQRELRREREKNFQNDSSDSERSDSSSDSDRISQRKLKTHPKINNVNEEDKSSSSSSDEDEQIMAKPSIRKSSKLERSTVSTSATIKSTTINSRASRVKIRNKRPIPKKGASASLSAPKSTESLPSSRKPSPSSAPVISAAADISDSDSDSSDSENASESNRNQSTGMIGMKTPRTFTSGNCDDSGQQGLKAPRPSPPSEDQGTENSEGATRSNVGMKMPMKQPYPSQGMVGGKGIRLAVGGKGIKAPRASSMVGGKAPLHAHQGGKGIKAPAYLGAAAESDSDSDSSSAKDDDKEEFAEEKDSTDIVSASTVAEGTAEGGVAKVDEKIKEVETSEGDDKDKANVKNKVVTSKVDGKRKVDQKRKVEETSKTPTPSKKMKTSSVAEVSAKVEMAAVTQKRLTKKTKKNSSGHGPNSEVEADEKVGTKKDTVSVTETRKPKPGKEQGLTSEHQDESAQIGKENVKTETKGPIIKTDSKKKEEEFDEDEIEADPLAVEHGKAPSPKYVSPPDPPIVDDTAREEDGGDAPAKAEPTEDNSDSDESSDDDEPITSIKQRKKIKKQKTSIKSSPKKTGRTLTSSREVTHRFSDEEGNTVEKESPVTSKLSRDVNASEKTQNKAIVSSKNKSKKRSKQVKQIKKRKQPSPIDQNCKAIVSSDEPDNEQEAKGKSSRSPTAGEPTKKKSRLASSENADKPEKMKENVPKKRESSKPNAKTQEAKSKKEQKNLPTSPSQNRSQSRNSGDRSTPRSSSITPSRSTPGPASRVPDTKSTASSGSMSPTMSNTPTSDRVVPTPTNTFTPPIAIHSPSQLGSNQQVTARPNSKRPRNSSDQPLKSPHKKHRIQRDQRVTQASQLKKLAMNQSDPYISLSLQFDGALKLISFVDDALKTQSERPEVAAEWCYYVMRNSLKQVESASIDLKCDIATMAILLCQAVVYKLLLEATSRVDKRIKAKSKHGLQVDWKQSTQQRAAFSYLLESIVSSPDGLIQVKFQKAMKQIKESFSPETKVKEVWYRMWRKMSSVGTDVISKERQVQDWINCCQSLVKDYIKRPEQLEEMKASTTLEARDSKPTSPSTSKAQTLNKRRDDRRTEERRLRYDRDRTRRRGDDSMDNHFRTNGRRSIPKSPQRRSPLRRASPLRKTQSPTRRGSARRSASRTRSYGVNEKRSRWERERDRDRDRERKGDRDRNRDRNRDRDRRSGGNRHRR